MLKLNNFQWKLRKLLCLLSFFCLSIPFIAAQGCPTPTTVSKDSTSITAVHYSWGAVMGARGYNVTYTTPSDTFSQQVFTNSVSFNKSINDGFEIFTVATICRDGKESEPSSLIDGGIVVTVDIIFRMADDCNDPTLPAPPAYVFFSDLCMYTHYNDICQAIGIVNAEGPPKPNQDPEEWLKAVLEELASGNYLWEPWDNPDGCQEPLRLQKPVLSQVKVGPNPFNKSFVARFYQENPGEVSFSIIDMMGRTLERRQVTSPFRGEQQYSGLGSTLSPGMYFLRIQYESQQLLINILKQE